MNIPVRLIAGFLILTLAATGLAAAQIGGGTGYFEINSDPSGASVYFDGSYRGTSPVTVSVSSTGTPSHTIRVTKSGYEDWYQDYDGNPFEGETVHIYASLTPIVGAGKGWYSISSSPSGATVYFDGSYKGTTPLTVEVSSTGTPGHTISLSLSGYQTWTQTYSGNPGEGQTIYVTANLQQVPSYGSITVNSVPSGATVTLDGSSSQITPATFYNVAAGSHSLYVTHSGYQPWSRTVTVSAGQNTPVTASLTQIPANTGTIYMVSTPQGASAYVDGVYYGITPALASGLSAGSHQVRLSLSGFQEWIGNVNVVGGSTTTVTQTLRVGTPTPTQAPGTGSIAVSSTPAGAQVFLDNVYEGITPLTISPVTAGSHSLLIKQPGYADWQATETVQSGQVTQVVATLSLSPAPSPTPAGTAIPGFLAVLGLIALVLIAGRR
ncbi:hypothetical protein ASZ90_015401 [hydrocarbon metagenome]|uniref:PEGA domain-containing protein n=1 Tax=hydrocarbon metagenome TaxID=938273 RepID=A0A0W8F3H9_9ZZZZ